MHCANILGETEIPPPAATPETAAGEIAASDMVAATAALVRLILFAIYLEIMHLLGYRIRRPRRAATTAKPALPRRPASPTPQPRQTVHYLDRDQLLANFAQISQSLEAALLAPEPDIQPGAAAPIAAIPAKARPIATPPAVISAALPSFATQRPEFRQKPESVPPSSHVLFVTLSEQ